MSSPAGQKMLVEDPALSFGSVQALSGISFTMYDKEILALIGPNGAGKISLPNCISGFYHPDTGRVLFKGRNISRLSPGLFSWARPDGKR
jgi:branched-chain amino acid transport system ATP-binding protein